MWSLSQPARAPARLRFPATGRCRCSSVTRRCRRCRSARAGSSSWTRTGITGPPRRPSGLATERLVTLVTRFFEPFREIPAASRAPTLRGLDRKGVQMRPTMFVDRIEEGRVVLRHFFSEREEVLEDCAAVVWIGHQRVNDALVQPLREIGTLDVHVIGDALSPRRMIAAVREGHDVGHRI